MSLVCHFVLQMRLWDLLELGATVRQPLCAFVSSGGPKVVILHSHCRINV
jgi:hypothetical protein